MRSNLTEATTMAVSAGKVVFELAKKSALVQQPVRAVQGRKVQIRDQSVLSFVSASYLGLERDERVAETAYAVAASWGFSLGTPRLLALDPFTKELENEIAALIGLERCLVFPSTTHVALDMVPAVTGPDGAIFVDAWTYPTLFEGIYAAARTGARIFRFPHNNLAMLSRQLYSTRLPENFIILCDGVYPEGGEPAAVREMAALVEEFGGWLCIDDSHSLGLYGRPPTDRQYPYGRGGGGVTRHFDLPIGRILVMGTLAKAVGIPIAFVAGPEKLLRKVEHVSTTFVHSSPPALPNIAAAIAALRITHREGGYLRERVGHLVEQFQARLRENHVPVLAHGLFPIETIPFRSNSSAISAGRYLRQRGIWPALQFSPPDQPNRGVLRFFITALHTAAEVDRTAKAIVDHMRNR